MKEATGELNMTIVTLVAVAALAALFAFVIWPIVQKMVVDSTCKAYGEEYSAVKNTGAGSETHGSGDAEVSAWKCCKSSGEGSSSDCFDPN